MYEDLVRQLRHASVLYNGLSELLPRGSATSELLDQAADAIERLSAEARDWYLAYMDLLPDEEDDDGQTT